MKYSIQYSLTIHAYHIHISFSSLRSILKLNAVVAMRDNRECGGIRAAKCATCQGYCNFQFTCSLVNLD